MWLDLAIIGQKLLIRHLPIQEFLLPCPSSINSHTNWQVVSIPNISHLHIISWKKYINPRFNTTPSYVQCICASNLYWYTHEKQIIMLWIYFSYFILMKHSYFYTLILPNVIQWLYVYFFHTKYITQQYWSSHRVPKVTRIDRKP